MKYDSRVPSDKLTLSQPQLTFLLNVKIFIEITHNKDSNLRHIKHYFRSV